jgi:hypothetical protein
LFSWAKLKPHKLEKWTSFLLPLVFPSSILLIYAQLQNLVESYMCHEMASGCTYVQSYACHLITSLECHYCDFFLIFYKSQSRCKLVTTYHKMVLAFRMISMKEWSHSSCSVLDNHLIIWLDIYNPGAILL